MFRRTRNCCCMNNNMDTDCNNTENILEDTCNNVISYSNDDMYDSCNCGFDRKWGNIYFKARFRKLL